jgi:predicted RNA-binding protein with PIN domain
MPWLVDGSNVLGAMRLDRHADDAKRYLASRVAAFARAKRTKATLFFDGNEPPSFARHLGALTVVFSGTRKADELIVERTREGRGANVVTSDRGLGARIAGRHVTIVSARQFATDLDAIGSTEEGSGDDWAAWFADPKNRSDF